MDFNDFSKFSEQLQDEVESGDYIHEKMSKVPRLRIHQDRTQNPPEGSQIGYIYSPNTGFIQPRPSLTVTILELVKIRTLWTPFTAKFKHLLCHCFDQELDYGILYTEQQDRWLPSEDENDRMVCSSCLYNRFRNPAFQVTGPIQYNEKPLSPEVASCRAGILFAGVILPDDPEVQVSLETVIPFYFQATSSIFSGAYTPLRNSWETFFMACKLAKPREIPIKGCKIELATTVIDTANGPTCVPTFDLVGVHAGAMAHVREVEGSYKRQLALKGSTQPIIFDDIEDDNIEE